MDPELRVLDTDPTPPKLTKCPECGSDIETWASSCPNCYSKISNPKVIKINKNYSKKIMLGLALFVLLPLLLYCYNYNNRNNYYNKAEQYSQLGMSIDAAKYYSKAAKYGHTKAQTKLGIALKSGMGTQQNIEEAFEWFKKAAESGDAEAQNELAEMYFQGQGVKEDQFQSWYWRNRAAEHGDRIAQYKIGLSILYDQGRTKNYIEGYKWIEKSSAQGYEQATQTLQSEGPEIKEASYLPKLITGYIENIDKQLGINNRTDTIITISNGKPRGNICVKFFFDSVFGGGGNNSMLVGERADNIARYASGLVFLLKKHNERNPQNLINCSSVIFEDIYLKQNNIHEEINYATLDSILYPANSKGKSIEDIGLIIINNCKVNK